MSDTERERLWLRRVRDLSRKLVEEEELEKLLPLVVDAAIELTGAERGYLALVQGGTPAGGKRVSERPPESGGGEASPRAPAGRPPHMDSHHTQSPNDGYRIKIRAARGFDKTTLRGPSGDVSRTVVERVLEQEDRGLVTTREEDADVLDASSVQARRVRSIACVPLRLRGEVRGVLYLDHRHEHQAFGEEDLPILRTFADQAALALETAQLLEEKTAADQKLGVTLRELHGLQRRLTAAEESGEDHPPPNLIKLGSLIGGSAAMLHLYQQLERASRTWSPVLILGESGTGKELVARELHSRGAAPQAPFLSENCGALAEGVAESELFGHKKGAFTGAVADREGLFREAGKGTLLLDEIGEASPGLQAKLLRVLQEGHVRPVGGDKTLEYSCRVLAATHRDLRALVSEGGFREDLYYRLDVIRIHVPPLRHRSEDVPLLLDHFAEKLGARLNLSPRALKLLTTYSWPGNVRELENEVRRLSSQKVRQISAQHLSEEVREGRGVARAMGDTSGKTLAQVEKEMLAAALRDCKGNKAQAARQLGIPRSTVYSLIKRHDLD